MNTDAFNLYLDLTHKKIEYLLHQPLWTKYDLTGFNFDFNQWTSFKYLNDAGTDLSDDVETVPDDAGGLYLFYAKCPVITGMTEFPFYIGRAQLTEHQNLRKRCKEYYQKYKRSSERPKITKMFFFWEKDLHFAYLPMAGNANIIEYEKRLINSLLLPLNDEIPDQDVRQAINAF